MEECFKCGISSDKTKLHDAISGKGIVKVCSRCAGDGDLPVMKRKEPSMQIADRNAPVGALIKEREKAFEQIRAGRKSSSARQDFALRDLVDKNYKQNFDTERKSFPGVTRNFNWIILRARRNKGYGQRQLAEMIGEQELAIRMAERGVLPKEYVPFVRKLEAVLEVDLMENHPFRLEEHKKMLNFKEPSSKGVTIGDLRDMTKKKEVEMIKSKGVLAKEKIEQEKKEQILDEGKSEEDGTNQEEGKKEPGFFKRLFSKGKQESPESEEEPEESQAL